MSKIDEIDRKILTRLKIDGRSSVTTLAGVLGTCEGHRTKSPDPPYRQ